MRKVITPGDAEKFRCLLIEAVNMAVKDEPAALAMSGGIDSMTLFFSLLELDIKFECYTFYQDGYESDDLLSSRKYCKLFNVPLIEIRLPSDPDTIYHDVVRVIPFCGKKIKKTKVETLRPLMYLFDQCGPYTILNGSAADDFQPYTRSCNVDLKEFGEEYCLQYRRNLNENPDDYDILSRELAKSYDHEFINVYADSTIEAFFLQFELSCLLTPHKALPVMAFRDYFDKCGGPRHHSSYQVNSRITDFHEKLLHSKYNRRNSQAVIAIYNDIAEEIKTSKNRLF